MAKRQSTKIGGLIDATLFTSENVQSIEEALAIQELYDFLSTQKSPTSVGTTAHHPEIKKTQNDLSTVSIGCNQRLDSRRSFQRVL